MGVVGWILLGLLFIAFAFFGLNSYLKTRTANYAALVNGVEITPRQQQLAYRTLRTRMQELMGDAYNPATLDEDALKSSALQKLIKDELLLQAADEAGFAASDQQVAASINSIDAFKQDGVFSKEKYTRILKLQGIPAGGFEWQLQRDIIIKQLQSGLLQTAIATPDEQRQAFMLKAQQRRIRYLTLPAKKFADQIEISSADIQNYYKTHADAFMTPERVKVQYLQLDAANIALDKPVDEAAVEALYKEHAETYVTPEQRHARHILIQLPPDADAAADAAALQKARDAIKRIEGGEDFAKVAKEVSDDPGSAPNGGDLGFFGRGVMTPSFEEAAFSLKPGELSEPVKSQFGYHVIEVMEIKPAVTTPLDEVRAKLEAELQADERSDLFYEKSETLSNLTFEQPDTLQGAADALGLEIQVSDWISRDGGSGIGADPKVVESAFSEDVLLNGNNSAPIETGDEQVIVLRVLEHEDTARQPLEAVRDTVKQRMIEDQSRKRAAEKGAAMAAALQSHETTLEEAAATVAVDVQNTGLVRRNDTAHPGAIVARAFSLDAPVDGKTVYDGFTTPDGDYAIIALDEVKQGDLMLLPEKARTQVGRELGSINGEVEMAAVLEALKMQAEIKIPAPSEE